MKPKINFAFIIGLSLLLCGCSLFAPVKVEPTTRYLINTASASVPTGKQTQSVLLVAAPQAISAFDTDHIAYSTQPYQIAYFAKNQWADSPTQMLQPLIIQALQNTHHFRAVVSAPFSGQYDVVLYTHLLELQQSFLQQPSQVHMTLRAQLIRFSTNQVIATRDFSAIKTAPQDTPYGGVIAANAAAREILSQLASFAVRNSVS